MMTICLLMGSFIFGCGVFGFLTRRNLILMFLSLELMLFGVSLNFVAFGSYHGDLGGQTFAILILTTAACEAALALAVTVALHRICGSLDVNIWRSLAECDAGLTEGNADPTALQDSRDATSDHAHDSFPKLTRAGRDPLVFPVQVGSDHSNPTSMA